MNIYVIEHLNKLQQHLSQHFELHQVLESDDGQCHWQQLSNGSFPPLKTLKPLVSAKDFFFAEQENLLVFDGEVFRETIPTPSPFVLFGVLSCDLSAIKYQDTFFKDDPYYQARRNQALLVGLDCLAPCEHGFCPTVDAGPGVRPDTADLTLHGLENGQWLLIEHTEKGALALEDLSLEPATNKHLAQRDLSLKKCEQKFPDDSYLTEGIKKLNDNTIPAGFWQELAIQCLGCSGCTTLCPTCSCYGTRSLTTEDDHITQQRFWDSCLYEGFQREASFNNPSKEAGTRVKRFWTHKFGDEYLKDFDHYGCVGCGRCEQTCPGIIGVHSVMRRLTDTTKESGND